MIGYNRKNITGCTKHLDYTIYKVVISGQCTTDIFEVSLLSLLHKFLLCWDLSTFLTIIALSLILDQISLLSDLQPPHVLHPFSSNAAHPLLLVFPSWQVRGVTQRVVPPARSPLSPHRSSCFYTTVSSSGAPVGLHAASLITAPRAFLELNLFCGTIHHKKAEYVLWLFRNKLRHYKKKKKAIKEGVWPIIHRLMYHNPRSVSGKGFTFLYFWSNQSDENW